MVDIGENLGGKFIFVITFLGIFVILVMAMPQGFYYSQPDYEETKYPSYWEAEDIKKIIWWGNTTCNRTFWGDWFYLTIERGSMDDYNVRIDWLTTQEVYFQHYWYLWGIFLQVEHIEPYPISESEILDNEKNGSSRFEMTTWTENLITYFTYDNNTYSNLTQAVNDGSLIISMGMDWDYESGALSGWDLVGRLLTFQLPDIHPILNGLIAIPIFACVGYVAFRLIMIIVKALPFT